jgi:hypothetical protein
MAWQSLEAVPITVGAQVTAQRATAVRAALLARTIPLARRVHGRPEPLATATLVAGRALALLTAAHIFEHAAVGDLLVPLPRDGAWARLHGARVRVLVHPQRDLALVVIADARLARQLRANWRAVPLADLDDADRAPAAEVYAVAGWPVSQARRHDGAVFMKPVVLFTRALDAARLAYARTAARIDGLEIHTPELDGVSGALVWSVREEAGAPEADCRLRAAAVQVAFAHGGYVRTEPLADAPVLLERLR